MFFIVKKNQKTFTHEGALTRKVFLLLFLQKKKTLP